MTVPDIRRLQAARPGRSPRSFHHIAASVVSSAFILWFALMPATVIASEKNVVIRSQPLGAKVVVAGGFMVCKSLTRGAPDGIAPCALSIDEGAFDPKGRARKGARLLGSPIRVTLSMDGYRQEALEITDGPHPRAGTENSSRSGNAFYFVKVDKFQVQLKKAANYSEVTSAPLGSLSASDALTDGRAFFDQNAPEKAIGALNVALSLSGDHPDPDIYHYRCMSNFLLNRLEAALKDCQELNRLRPSSELGWNNAGLISQALGRNIEAIANFSKALELKPGNIKALRNRAASYERLNAVSKALSDYSAALKVAPSDAETLIGRARLYNGQRDCKLAENDAEAAIATAQRAEALVERGDARACEERYPEAADDFTSAIAVNPALTLAFAKRCEALLAMNQAETALKDCDLAVKKSPEAAYFLVERAEVKLALHRYSDALTDVQNAALKTPKNARIFDIEGRANEGLGQLDLARADYDEAIRLDATRAVYYARRARIWRLNNKADKAQQDLAAARRLISSGLKASASVQAELDLEARALAGIGLPASDDGRALRPAPLKGETVAERDPKNLEAMSALAASYVYANNNLDEAERLLKKVLESDPNNADCLHNLGWLYFRKLQLIDADRYLRAALKRTPHDSQVLDHLAELSAAQGNWREAATFWGSALVENQTPGGRKFERIDLERIRSKADEASTKAAKQSAQSLAQ